MELSILQVVGLIQGTTEGNYSLLLQEQSTNIRMPILIGAFEAQAIAIAMEGKEMKRPLTHDLFASFISIGNIEITQLVIHGLVDGVFYSHLYYKIDNQEEQFINCRPSDGVAMSLRFGTPIKINKQLLKEYGIEMNDDNDFITEDAEQPGRPAEDGPQQDSKSFEDLLKSFSLSQLQKMLDDAERNEDYEQAAKIRDEISRR